MAARGSRFAGAGLLALLVPLWAWGSDDVAEAPKMLRDSFESGRTAWREEATDQTFRLYTHDRSEQSAHEGRLAERFVFEAGAGSALYYSYPLPKVPVTNELMAALYVRSNRPGVQIFGKVYLPSDRDPVTGKITEVFVPGTIAVEPDRWQKVELTDLVLGVERQARVIRAATGREVSLEGAYLARVVVNLYGGPGESEVYLDELEVGPLPAEVAAELAEGPEAPAVEPATEPEAEAEPEGPSTGRVQLVGPALKKDGADWFPAIVEAPGADPALLYRAGFDVLAMDPIAEPKLAARAAELGLLLMPRLDPRGDADPEVAASAISELPEREAVAFLDLGERLGSIRDPEARRRELEGVRDLIFALRRGGKDRPRITAGTVDGLFPQYAQFGSGLDLIGVAIPPPGGMHEPMDTFRYLRQRRNLTATSNPNAVFMAWVPTTSPSAVRAAVWGLDVPPAWGWPQVQPEQMRLAAYAALAAGYRGLGFRGDAELTAPGGISRLYEASLLIAEIALIEPLLAQSNGPLALGQAFPPDPKPKLEYNSSGRAGGFATLGAGNKKMEDDFGEVSELGDYRVASIDSLDGRTKLLIVTNFAGGAQWVPPLMAMAKLNLLIPAPESAQAYEISLGGVTKLESWRDTFGRRIVLETFNTSALVLLTTDPTIRDRLEAEVNRLRPRAVDIAIHQAEIQLAEAEVLDQLMQQRGMKVPRRDFRLLSEAREILDSARQARDRTDYALAWSEARTVGQAIRMRMRDYWDLAYKDLVKATEANAKVDGVPPMYDDRGKPKRPEPLIAHVACPPLLSVQTMPQFPYWLDWIAGRFGPFGANRMPNGDFSDPDAMAEDGWVDVGYPVEDVRTELKIVSNEGWGRPKSALRLTVGAENLPDPKKFEGPDGKRDDVAYQDALLAAVDALAPFLDHPVAAVRSPSIPVRATNFIRIRVLVKMPREIPGGYGGLIVRDSLGGEALQFRYTSAIPEWREIVLYRRAPADGEVSVTLGLAGLGEVFFDDLRIEVVGDPTTEPAPTSGGPVARRPESAPRGAAIEPPTPSLPRR